MIEKREHVRTVLTVNPSGTLAGHTFEMTRMPASAWIALRRGDLDDGGLVAAAMEAVTDSSLPEGTELDMAEAMDLMNAWVKAHREDAVPPA